MLVSLIEKYGDLIQSWSTSDFDQAGPNLRFRGQVTFVDHSVLFIRQVVPGESTFKYAYHWQDREGHLIGRWDNSSHWPEIATYPHHKHITFCGKVGLPSQGKSVGKSCDGIA